MNIQYYLIVYLKEPNEICKGRKTLKIANWNDKNALIIIFLIDYQHPLSKMLPVILFFNNGDTASVKTALLVVGRG